jgi:hypothetical protein
VQELERDGWRVAFDPEATRRATARLPRGAAETCGCVGCREYLERREALLGRELRALLEQLGCDPAKEWELTPLARDARGRREVLAAWRFRGEVLAPGPADGALRFVVDPERAGEALLELDLAFEVPEAGEGR